MRRKVAVIFIFLSIIMLCVEVITLAQEEEEISGGVSFPVEDAPPMVLSVAQVVYPPQYAEKAIEGTVELMVWVSEDGSIGEIQISKPMEIAAFNEAAIAAISEYEFSAAISGGEPVGSWLDLTISFTVKKEE